MFTGIVKAQAKVKVLKQTNTDITIEVDLSSLNTEMGIGDSIAINGVCLTIVSLEDKVATFDLMNETLEKTNFRELKDGGYVNVEPSMKLNDKLDGHIVYGDVDSVGFIESIKEVGDSKIYTFSYPKDFAKYLIDKGRVTIDGASLTVIDSKEDGLFSVSFIPHSLRELNISEKIKGDKVNIEFDIYAKIIFKQRRFND